MCQNNSNGKKLIKTRDRALTITREGLTRPRERERERERERGGERERELGKRRE